MSDAKHTPGPRSLGKKSANPSMARVLQKDAQVRKELHLTPAQLQYLKTAEGGAVKDWAAPSIGTIRSRLRRGLLEHRDAGGIQYANTTVFYYVTLAGYHALDIADRLSRAAIAKATGSAS